MLISQRLADSNNKQWNEDELSPEDTPEPRRALAAQYKANGALPKPEVGVTKDARQPGADRQAASFTASEYLDSWRSPWEGQQIEQPAEEDSAMSRHSQTSTRSVLSLEEDKPGPGFKRNPVDSYHSPWEDLPRVSPTCLLLATNSYKRCSRCKFLIAM